MRQAALTVALVLLFTGVSAIAEAQDPNQLEQSCNAGDLKACIELGRLYEYGGLGLKGDRTRAMSLFERACNGGSPEGCYHLGRTLAHTTVPAEKEKDMARAVQLYEKACDAKFSGGCYELGSAYKSGQGVGRDYKQASALFEKACELGSSMGCWGVVELAQPKNNILPDVKRWATFMEKRCNLGGRDDAETCFALGLHYDLGLAVPKDPDHANELFKKACLFGKEEACKLVVRK